MISMLPIELKSPIEMHAGDPNAHIGLVEEMSAESVSVTLCDLTAKASKEHTVIAQGQHKDSRSSITTSSLSYSTAL